jgi:hypothetical protein
MFRTGRSIAGLLVAALMTLTVLAPAAAGSSDRPFKGFLVGGGDPALDGGCPYGLRTDSWGSGEVTHLGLATMTSSHCTPLTPATEPQPISGVGRFVAANGDILEMTYTGMADPIIPFIEGAPIRAWSHHVITGGTGRFADATGEFDMTVTGVLHFTSPMVLMFELGGTVSY